MPTWRLFTPLRIGALDVPNRIMQAAHSKLYSDRFESDRETAYFVRRAEGGCALFVAGNHARVIGDALAPRNIDAAILDAVEVAYASAGYEHVDEGDA